MVEQVRQVRIDFLVAVVRMNSIMQPVLVVGQADELPEMRNG